MDARSFVMFSFICLFILYGSSALVLYLSLRLSWIYLCYVTENGMIYRYRYNVKCNVKKTKKNKELYLVVSATAEFRKLKLSWTHARELHQ
ncbi:hypothetical protein VNO77_00057 [Canavalia gladiata]|uniref:Uncharacterized protein n=1 Tax=Canavalia gladiata TaxID=3824 RepID=A0AAN9MQF0_CANGL